MRRKYAVSYHIRHGGELIAELTDEAEANEMIEQLTKTWIGREYELRLVRWIHLSTHSQPRTRVIPPLPPTGSGLATEPNE